MGRILFKAVLVFESKAGIGAVVCNYSCNIIKYNATPVKLFYSKGKCNGTGIDLINYVREFKILIAAVQIAQAPACF